MLIVTTIENQPSDFKLFAQNMISYEICGTTNIEGYDEVKDIPSGFEQRVLPPQYGIYLTMQQIENGLLLENNALIKQQSDIDYLAIMMGVDL